MAGAAKQVAAKAGTVRQNGSGRSTSRSGHTSASSSQQRTNSVRSVDITTSNSLLRARSGFDGSADSLPPPQRNPATSGVLVDPKHMNFDLGMQGWKTLRGAEISTSMPTRQPPSKAGQPAKIGLNIYNVDTRPMDVYQFDVMIGNGVEKRGVINKVWNSKAVQAAIGPFSIFDGNKLAWSGKPITRDIKLTIDLDAEKGEPPKPRKDGKTNEFRIMIRQTNKIGFAQLTAHLQGKADFDNACLEAINFYDHLLRETPSKTFTAIKRNFFERGEQRFNLGGGVEAFKGVYQSLRVVHPGRLSINCDVANGTFWSNNKLVDTAVLLTGSRDLSDLAARLTDSTRGGEKGQAGQAMKKLRKIHVISMHRGKPKPDEFCIDKFMYGSDPRNPITKSYKFKALTPTGQEVETSLYDFYARKYNVRLNYPGLPLVKVTKGKNTMIPMEVLMIKQNQRYAYKMDEKQTSNMIKFAVTAPPQRYAHIEEKIKMLAWAQDPMLQKYGVKVNTSRTVVDARILIAPVVKFGAGEAKPGTSGRWDLKGKKFLVPNPQPLKSWAICIIGGRRGGKPDRTTIETFIKAFVQGYINHGGRVEMKQPPMYLAQGDEPGKWVTDTWNLAGNTAQSRPQILFFILPDKDGLIYGRIKRSCECRYGVVSQCVQYSHAQKAQPQYISNVLMKFNAKLGGVTCRAVGPKSGGANGLFTCPSLIIGADVSHSAPGVQAPSMAAMTVSVDKLATRYAALCQNNGYRVEMINADIIKTELKPLIQHWAQNLNAGKLPQRIFYMRDGVSEGQYAHVLEQEVRDMKQMLKSVDASNKTQFIVVVGSKRHHIRFFPEKGGDRNGNALPGTLVETGVTNPAENDFYLCSHAAIKGTARPVHYYVLLNEAKVSNDELHTLLYEHAYQYQRATTPISQHPAIYYAHLAALRAVPHDPNWPSSVSGSNSKTEKQQSGSKSNAGGSQGGGSQGRSGTKLPTSEQPVNFAKLMPMPNQGGLATSMWFI